MSIDSNKIYLSPPYTSEKELKYLKEAVESGWIAPNGPFVERFQNQLSQTYTSKKIVATNSGSSALHIALKLIGIKSGDYVLCPTFTFAASVFPVLYEKAIPVFIDSEKTTWNLSPEYLEQAIVKLLAQDKKPKALILVHVYGMPAQIEQIISICSQYQIPIIEDAAEALGSTYNKQPLGTFGEVGVLSFNGNKIVTTSAGGAIITANENQFKKAKYWINQAKSDTPYYEHNEVGYNYTMSNLNAAVGVAQLENLEDRVKAKRENYKQYKDFFLEKNIAFSNQEELKGAFSNRWLSTFILDKKLQQKIVKNLSSNQIETRYLWNPLHLQKAFSGTQYFGKNESIELFNKGICLPSGAGLTDKEKEKIYSIISQNL